MNETTLWAYLAPVDRETFISGILAWLMDQKGNHGLREEFLKRILHKAGIQILPSDKIQIVPEDISKEGKRFDIAIWRNDRLIIILEIKCKTRGSKKQLQRYEHEAKVIRVGFDEWNFPYLEDSDLQKYPLIKFSEISEFLNQCIYSSDSPYSVFLKDFRQHLDKESEFFTSLKNYFIEETSIQRPEFPTFHRYSHRFYNSLYWEWLHERLKRERQFSKIEWEPGAGSSGVWFASKVMRISAGKIKNFSKINLNLPGEFQYWVHVELANKKGILAQPNESVGYIQLRIWKDIPTNQWRHIYQIIKLASTELEKLGFRLPKREPNQKQDTYSALTRKLRLDEFRYSKLLELIDILI